MNQEALNIAVKAVQIYAEKHPRPHQITQVQAASMLGTGIVNLAFKPFVEIAS